MKSDVVMESQRNQQLGIDELIGDKRDEVLRLADKYGAYNVRVFGSVARGEATSTSDVDFLVDLHAGATIFDLIGLWQDLTELLEREVDVSTEKELKPRIRSNALKDAVPV